MAEEPRYKRILVKLSGEGFCPTGGFGIDPAAQQALVDELVPLVEMGVQVALVVGGGNIIRGRQLAGTPVRRTTADYMGMLATAINALALRDVLESRGVPARVLNAVRMDTVCEPMIISRAVDHLQRGRVVIFAGGTGRPFFTTDSGAALRAREIEAEALVKATKVDGVYDADPETHPDATRYDELSYEQVLAQRLGVMDLTAISLCMEGGVPIIVLRVFERGNLARAVRGEKVGTRIGE